MKEQLPTVRVPPPPPPSFSGALGSSSVPSPSARFASKRRGSPARVGVGSSRARALVARTIQRTIQRTVDQRDGRNVVLRSGTRRLAFGVLVVVLSLAIGAWIPLGGSNLRAADRAVIPSEDSEWRDRLLVVVDSLADLESSAGGGAESDERSVGASGGSRVAMRRALDNLQRAFEQTDAAVVGLRYSASVARPATLDDWREALSRPRRRAARGGTGSPAVVPRRVVSDAAVDARRQFLTPRSIAHGVLSVASPGVVDAYRSRFEPSAQGLLEDYRASGRVETLERLATSYFFTASGSIAAEELADRHLEAGDAVRAGEWFRALLFDAPAPPSRESSGAEASGAEPALPDLERIGAKWLLSTRLRGALPFEAALEIVLRRLSAAGGGLSDRGARIVAEIRDDSTLSDRGRASESRDAAGASDPSRATTRPAAELERFDQQATSWWGGEAPGDRLPSLPQGTLGLSWDNWIWAEPPSITGPESSFRVQRRRQVPGHGFGYDTSTAEYPFFPLVDGDLVWMSGVYGLFEIDGRVGMGRAIRALLKPDPSSLRIGYRYREKSDTALYGAAIWRRDHELIRRDAAGASSALPDVESILITHYVADRVRFESFMGYDVSAEIPVRALVAYDLATGDVLWRTRPFDAAGPSGPSSPDDASRQQPESPKPPNPRLRDAREQFAPVQVPADIVYTSAPVVRGNRVYAAGWGEEGFVNALVRCLDLRTGQVIWKSQVASSQMEMTMFGELAREPFASYLELRDGVLYFQSNLGCVAALDPDSGRVEWASTYELYPIQPALGPVAHRRALVWGLCAPVRVGPLLIVAPRDSRGLFAIDVGAGPDGAMAAGRIRWSYDNSHGDLRDLLGYRDGRIYFTSESGVACLDLDGLRPDGSFPRGTGPKKIVASRIWNRVNLPSAGALCDTGVVYCDERMLWRIGFDLTGAPEPLLANPFPAADHGHRAGRVFVAPGRVFVASNSLISAFAPVPPPGGPDR